MKTYDRTVISYFTKPLHDQISRALPGAVKPALAGRGGILAVPLGLPSVHAHKRAHYALASIFERAMPLDPVRGRGVASSRVDPEAGPIKIPLSPTFLMVVFEIDNSSPPMRSSEMPRDAAPPKLPSIKQSSMKTAPPAIVPPPVILIPVRPLLTPLKLMLRRRTWTCRRRMAYPLRNDTGYDYCIGMECGI
jgi:hypothetical protein